MLNAGGAGPGAGCPAGGGQLPGESPGHWGGCRSLAFHQGSGRPSRAWARGSRAALLELVSLQ